jgi:AcrR family transcriptional regulator
MVPSEAHPSGDVEVRPEVLDAAFRLFLRGEKMEMSALAAELGIGRTTLYRWTVDRETVMRSLLWTLARNLFRVASIRSRHRGPQRIVDIAVQVARDVAADSATVTFVRNEPHTAMRLLLSPVGIEPACEAWLAAAIGREREVGAFACDWDDARIAEQVYRMTASLTHPYVLADVEPPFLMLRDTLTQLLVPPVGRRTSSARTLA